MRTIRLALLLSSCICLLPLTASADVVVRGEGDLGRGLTNITMSQSVTIPVKEGVDQLSQQNETLRSFYSLVGGTCRTVLETIADTCEITNISLTLRSSGENYRARRPDQEEMITINGQIQMLVKLKADVGPPSPENSSRGRNRPAGTF